MKALTEKQKNILEFINEFVQREHMAPTVYEIADEFQIKTSTVFAHLRALQRKNQLTRSSKARSIALTGDKPRFNHANFMMAVPLLSKIKSGLPADNLEYKESDVFIDSSLIPSVDQDKIFALRITDDSMHNLGIFPNDVIILRQTTDVRPGDIVAAMVNDETTVRSFQPQRGGKIELRAANQNCKSQIYSAEQVVIQGRVIGLHREY